MPKKKLEDYKSDFMLILPPKDFRHMKNKGSNKKIVNKYFFSIIVISCRWDFFSNPQLQALILGSPIYIMLT